MFTSYCMSTFPVEQKECKESSHDHGTDFLTNLLDWIKVLVFIHDISRGKAAKQICLLYCRQYVCILTKAYSPPSV